MAFGKARSGVSLVLGRTGHREGFGVGMEQVTSDFHVVCPSETG